LSYVRETRARVVIVFLDTNVLVAAFATRGPGADLLRTILAEHELVSSATVCEGLTRTLKRWRSAPTFS
jgi:hypothetical protein